METFLLKFEDIILEYRETINEELLDIYNDGPNNIKEPIHHILKGGKRLRPILCKLVCLCCNGNQKSTDIVATSIELLHNFTLIHDDIMDNDILRHGRETIHHKWNDSIAILSGDAMLAIALIRLAEINENKSLILEKFNEGLIQVCEGQALDLAFQSKSNVNVQEYLTMIDKKTGYMLGLSAEMGAIVSKMNIDTQIKLKQYGMLIGRAFQIQDDLLEIISNQDKMGKSLKSDFLLNKKTYLTIRANDIDAKTINKYIELSKNDFNLGFSLYKDFLEKNNIIDDSNELIASIIDSARNILNEIDVDTNYLNRFTDLILNRNS